MLGISSTPRSPRSAGINSAGPPEEQSGRTELSSSLTTKACGNPRGSLKLLPFLQRQPRTGNLSTGQIAADPNVLRFVNTFYPLPNGSLLGAGDTGIFTFAGQQVTPENYFTTKADHKLSESDALAGTYMFDSGTVRQPDELNNKRTGYDSRRQVFTLHETHSFNPQLLSSFQFGINRVVATTGLTFLSGNPAVADPSFGTVPTLHAAAIIVPGLTFFSGGLETPSSYRFHWTSIQASDDVSLRRELIPLSSV